MSLGLLQTPHDVLQMCHTIFNIQKQVKKKKKHVPYKSMSVESDVRALRNAVESFL